jgi:hypothetical protein
MALEWVEMADKHPAEILQYKFLLGGISAFADDGETVSLVSWHIYDTDNLNADLNATMMAASGDGTENGEAYVTIDIRSDVSGQAYRVVGIITGASGRKHGVFGTFRSKNLGVSAT